MFSTNVLKTITLFVSLFVLAHCSDGSDDDTTPSTEPNAVAQGDGSVDDDTTTQGDGSVEDDMSADTGDDAGSEQTSSGEPVELPSSVRCLDDDADCGGNYCCKLFHYCVERCTEIGTPCSDPNFVCRQGYMEPLCVYRGPEMGKEYAKSKAGGACVLDEDCLPGFFCAPSLRFCVEKCETEGERCPITGNTCSVPAYASAGMALPMLACVYQEGDPAGTGSVPDTDETASSSQSQKENACDCMFSSGVYPDPSLKEACVASIPDRCVVCLESAVTDTSTCGLGEEAAVLSCTDPCSRILPPPESVEGCKEMSATLNVQRPSEETDCLCQNCTYWYSRCLVDPDCFDHYSCMVETGCSGMECITACDEVIDRVLENNADSVNISKMVSECEIDNCAQSR